MNSQAHTTLEKLSVLGTLELSGSGRILQDGKSFAPVRSFLVLQQPSNGGLKSIHGTVQGLSFDQTFQLMGKPLTLDIDQDGLHWDCFLTRNEGTLAASSDLYTS